ncbi:MAG: threonine transporter RhtB [Phycisphaeraceae bacterium]|nr:threonine transporter RhtB [Phycisphaeraceae bacterium]
MLSSQSTLTFLAASILLALAPGPDNIFVLTQSALHGRNAGLVVTLGLCTGLLAHSAAVALGIAAIVQASVIAFTTIKYVGAAYLLYLAWQAIRARATEPSAESGSNAGAEGLYWRGIIMNVTNPKVSIFFLAFLPQFVDPARGYVIVQILLLGGLFIVATVVVFGSVALLAGSISDWFTRSERVQVILNRIAAVVFIGLALKLVTSPR